ncbi:MAG: TetR/AcrR family transcriptional regulator C-terminal domain-containing protein [Microbacterium sp.]|uniref:TetR/AcrR family transcriptional regulator C-terminal domain-containing protein n=1 Tax=Microbacterium sp. TaxID=51671 RepID=UPI001AC62531|nr:TetR/AcrR family transcriptional regulator C-terminal domain-containing protein [Microbacterium sp.]MBN9176067.1 TetR/AcrR family transcriptional regulator C-terminal domain-containing protein [Microbacterium sp.]
MVRPLKPKLSRPAIASAAIAAVDADGDFTIEQLASKLGVAASSLYNHVSGRADIVELMRDELFADTTNVPDLGSWELTLTAFVGRYRAALGRHPRVIPLLIGNTLAGPTTTAFYQALATILRHAGFDDAQLLDAVTTVDVFALGAGLDLSTPEDMWRPERFPPGPMQDALMAGTASPGRSDRAFDFGLAVMVAGLRETLAGRGPQAGRWDEVGTRHQ